MLYIIEEQRFTLLLIETCPISIRIKLRTTTNRTHTNMATNPVPAPVATNANPAPAPINPNPAAPNPAPAPAPDPYSFNFASVAKLKKLTTKQYKKKGNSLNEDVIIIMSAKEYEQWQAGGSVLPYRVKEVRKRAGLDLLCNWSAAICAAACLLFCVITLIISGCIATGKAEVSATSDAQLMAATQKLQDTLESPWNAFMWRSWQDSCDAEAILEWGSVYKSTCVDKNVVTEESKKLCPIYVQSLIIRTLTQDRGASLSEAMFAIRTTPVSQLTEYVNTGKSVANEERAYVAKLYAE